MLANRLRTRSRTLLLAAVAAGAILLAVGAYAADLFRRAELDTVDARFAIRGTEPAPKDMVLVLIDDVTFDELHQQWPFPRSLHGRLVDRLRRDGARVIAYDVQFTEPTKVAEDNALIRAVDGAPRVVLATTEVNARGESRVFGGEQVLRQIGARAARSDIQPDPGGVFRRIAHDVGKLDTFAVAATELATGRTVPRNEFGGGRAWID